MSRTWIAFGLGLWVAAVGCGDTPEPVPDANQPTPTGFSVTGVVTDLTGRPVVDLFVTVSTEFCIPDRTGQDGGFEITRVQTGPKRLITYGETSSISVASVAIQFDADRAFTFEESIALPILDQDYALDVAGTSLQTIETREGLSIDILPGALTLAPFASPELQVARVPLAQAPDFPPESLELVDLFVLHPILSTLSPPSPLRFPNDLGLSPGTGVRFHTLDYETGALVVAATGTVDSMGYPTTDPGQGISELTWVGLSVVEN